MRPTQSKVLFSSCCLLFTSGCVPKPGEAAVSETGSPVVGGQHLMPRPLSEGDVGASDDPCSDPQLTWKSARKTSYESYPEPGSVECVQYNGCKWAGWFAGCREQQSEQWVREHNIAALFPSFEDHRQHDLCIRAAGQTMRVTVYDTCGDDDCNGCCTANRGQHDALIDLESYTNARWGLADGVIEWADLGPTSDPGCE